MITEELRTRRAYAMIVGFLCSLAALVFAWMYLVLFTYSGNWNSIRWVTLAAWLAFNINLLCMLGINYFLLEKPRCPLAVFFFAGMLSLVFGVVYLPCLYLARKVSHAT